MGKGVKTENTADAAFIRGELRGVGFEASAENGRLKSLSIGESIKAEFSVFPAADS